jgi:uncharacterized cysteine cluster protein YcgN (CxxCxxCC family)
VKEEIPFWERPLETLTTEEWERLCDGCGRCCLKKLSDEDTGEIAYTRVVCRFFDQRSSRCTCYDNRCEQVPDCLQVREHDIAELAWMPDTCAYRLRSENKPLYEWHPLLAGSRKPMEMLGISVAGRVLSEEFVHEDGLAEHVIRWVTADG